MQINKIAYVVKKIELHRFKLSRKIVVKNFFGKRLRRNRFVLLFNDNTMIIHGESIRESDFVIVASKLGARVFDV